MKKFRIILISSLSTLLLCSGIFGYFILKEKSSEPLYLETNQNANARLISEQKREGLTDDITTARQNFITNTVKQVSPAVVGINVTQIRKIQEPFANDPFMRYFFGDRSYNQQVKSLGSGAIISPDGYIITNDHVAGNATEIIVTMTDGSHRSAKLIGTDQIADISLLKIEGDSLPFIKLGNSDDILIGEWVIALGNPFGLFDINDKPTVTVGVVSATGMNLGQNEGRFYVNMIQTDAAINGGNSGGPLVNSLGELIGMNTLIYSQSGGNVGVGFAIPVNKIKKVITELKTKGNIDRNFWTGLIGVQTVDEGIAKYYKLLTSQGVIITQLAKNSPADRAGLEVGDIVLEIDNYKINNDNTLISVLQEYRTGDTIKVTIIRNNNKLTKQMTLERRND